MKSLRQGDVLLIPVKVVPKGAKKVIIKDDLILAFGEATGHAHRIKDVQKAGVVAWDVGAERFIQAANGASLTHEEHGAVVLEPGVIYRQAFQVNEQGETVRRVAD